MGKYTTTILIVILGITDAYLISHPNILGRLGIFIYKYDMLKTFPKALLTVAVTLGCCYTISYLSGIYSHKPWSRWLLWLGLVLSLAVLAQVYIKFSGGSYRLTGKPFRYGMHLLPVLMAFIFASKLWKKIE
jgi:hypothetical protein